MRGAGRNPSDPSGQDDDYVVVPPAERPIRVAFDAPEPSADMQARPLRVAMIWIAILVLLGLFWSSVTPEETAPRPTPARRPAGTTTL